MEIIGLLGGLLGGGGYWAKITLQNPNNLFFAILIPGTWNQVGYTYNDKGYPTRYHRGPMDQWLWRRVIRVIQGYSKSARGSPYKLITLITFCLSLWLSEPGTHWVRLHVTLTIQRGIIHRVTIIRYGDPMGVVRLLSPPPPNNTQKQLWGTETQVNSLHFSRAFQRGILGSQRVEGLLRLSDPKWISVPSQVRKKVFFFLRPDLYLKLTLGHSNSINHQSV